MENKVIHLTMTVKAPIQQVWEAWTTEKGITSFLAPDCKINLEVYGAYEIYFNPAANSGEKGGEGVKILAFEKPNMFSFTWNAPPHLPNVRKMYTHVSLFFKEINLNQTMVSFYHDGWGSGPEWTEAFNYFNNAWQNVVFPRFKYAMEVEPIDWNKLPKL